MSQQKILEKFILLADLEQLTHQVHQILKFNYKIFYILMKTPHI